MPKGHTKSAYINILQGKTGRWIEGVSLGNGLYTDEITTCKIFLFFGEKGGRRAISMTHYDGYTSVDDIQSEHDWFDAITHIYICLKPESALQGNFKELFGELGKELSNRNITFKKADITQACDGVLAGYDDDSSKSHIRWVNTSKRQLPMKLINHPQACQMYAYYKMNVMFAEIEGDWKQLVAYYNGDSIRVGDSNYYSYGDNTRHINTLCKHLAGKVTHQQVMYDGNQFKPLGVHDQSPTPCAEVIMSKLPKTISVFDILVSSLIQALTDQEYDELTSRVRLERLYGHAMRDWTSDLQAYELSKAICLAVYKKSALLPSDYQRVIERYSVVPSLRQLCFFRARDYYQNSPTPPSVTPSALGNIVMFNIQGKTLACTETGTIVDELSSLETAKKFVR